MGRQFDVVLMNPPYQGKVARTTNGGAGSGSALWPEFVLKSLSLCKNGGFCVHVHPGGWRKPTDGATDKATKLSELWPLLSQKRMKYLEIHSKKDGEAVFGASTRFDWYILQNSDNDGNEPTVVINELGKKNNLNLGKFPFLPNYAFKDIQTILGKNGDRLEVLYSCSSHHQRPCMSKTKTAEFKYPCVHGMYRQQEENTFLYSNVKPDHCVPKVILGVGESLYPMIDIEGEFGMTDHAFGLPVKSAQHAKCLKAAIESQRFREIVKATKWSQFTVDWRMFTHFKRDFWRQFVDEQGNELTET